MGTWKDSPKADGVRAQGPAARASGKAPFPGVTSGNVAGQENPRRERRQDYTPSSPAATRNRNTARSFGHSTSKRKHHTAKKIN